MGTIDETDEGLTLSVTPSFDIIGKILSWNLDEVTASKCVERIAGLKLISYCGYFERKARKKIKESMQKVQNVKLPAVVQKLERKLQMKVGKTIPPSSWLFNGNSKHAPIISSSWSF